MTDPNCPDWASCFGKDDYGFYADMVVGKATIGVYHFP
jgi:hypothetical protein